ncbi:uncharacterized protein TNCV_1848131 [Trichonephila clavipes]|nr:uncharacterized protein TNCV_1848131 [Trichonephila clavipes]
MIANASGVYERRPCRQWLAVREILYKGTLARNPRCSRRRLIDETDISIPVAVDQHAANCQEEAVRSFNTMRGRCRSSHADVTFRRPMPVFRVVRCSSVHFSLTSICRTFEEKGGTETLYFKAFGWIRWGCNRRTLQTTYKIFIQPVIGFYNEILITYLSLPNIPSNALRYFGIKPTFL